MQKTGGHSAMDAATVEARIIKYIKDKDGREKISVRN
jgi:hypothetical protein